MDAPARPMRLDDIVARLGGRVVGDGATLVSQVAALESAGPGQIGFVANPKYLAQLGATRAAAVVLPEAALSACPCAAIVADDPYLYFARLSQLLNPPPAALAGVHATATCASDRVAASASIGPGAHVGRNVAIGERVVVGPGCWIGDDVEIGDDSLLHGNVSIYAGCIIGRRAILHSGAVIGADGFGFAREKSGRWVKIPQIGRVILGDDVEIGANATVDRGALEDTLIGNGVKIDNLVQVAHNVHIGDDSALAGCVGIAGSARIGKRVMLGGQAGVVGHLSICDDVTVSSATAVAKSIREPGVYTGQLPAMPHADWQKNLAQLRRLDALADRIRALEKALRDVQASAASQRGDEVE